MQMVRPKHIAIIMDGNGRYARKRFMPRVFGHKKGVESARKIVDKALALDLPFLTLFAFSSENWRREAKEVDFLMKIMLSLLEDEVHDLHAKNIRLKVIGSLDRLSHKLVSAIDSAQKLTKNNQGLTLVIALNYGGKWDISQAAKLIAKDVVSGKLAADSIDEAEINKRLSTHGIPDPELVIRTSGEMRLSNFMLWQLAYTEFFFVDKFWPDFTEQDLNDAIVEFGKRDRRFGQTSNSEQQTNVN